MKPNLFIFFTFLLLIIGFLTFRFSLSYFSDTGQSIDNILSASSEFPTATPTVTPTPLPITNTPTPTPTPANCTQYCQSIGSTMLGCSLNLTKCRNDFGGTTGIQNNDFCSPPDNFCCCQ